MCEVFFDDRVVSALSKRRHGNMSLSYGDTAHSLRNRDAFLKPLGIDYRRLVCLKQVHGGTVRYVTEDACGSGAIAYNDAIENTDALITDKPGVPLVVLTADCLSIFLYDPKMAALGLVHAGWRSTRERIVLSSVRAMQDNCKAQPRDLRVRFGPAIQRCCYEVGSDVMEYFPHSLHEREGCYFLDLAQENREQLIVAGVPSENIIG